MSEIEIVEERLRRFAASPDERDWPDVLRRADAASRGRPASTSAPRRNVRLVVALAGIVVVSAVVAVAAVRIGGGTQPVSKRVGHHSHALTGATIQLAGYRFRTPAGFKGSSGACADSGPLLRGFSSAASAEGGCIYGGILTLESTGAPSAILAHIPAKVEPVAVGDYQGYFLAHAPPDSGCHPTPPSTQPCSNPPPVGDMALYVFIPHAAGPGQLRYVVLYAEGLTEYQLIEVARSGLPSLSTSTTPTCTENCG